MDHKIQKFDKVSCWSPKIDPSKGGAEKKRSRRTSIRKAHPKDGKIPNDTLASNAENKKIYKDKSNKLQNIIKINPDILPIKIQIKPDILPIKIQIKVDILPIKLQIKPDILPIKIQIKPDILPIKQNTSPLRLLWVFKIILQLGKLIQRL